MADGFINMSCPKAEFICPKATYLSGNTSKIR